MILRPGEVWRRGTIIFFVLLAIGSLGFTLERQAVRGLANPGELAAAMASCFPDRDVDRHAGGAWIAGGSWVPTAMAAAGPGKEQLAGAPPGLRPEPEPQPRIPGDAPLYIVIDIAARRLTLYRGGETVLSFPVAVGKPGWASPVGEWRVVRKARDWGGGFGTRWLGLDVPWGIYGIHGTNKDWSIGGAESHGCFRMFNWNVEDLWERVPEGTPVTIRGPWDFPFWQVPARPPFRPGQNGQPIVYLQLLLRREGFDPGVADGRYDPETEAAVRALERFYGLPEDGVADRQVLQFLDGRESF